MGNVKNFWGAELTAQLEKNKCVFVKLLFVGKNTDDIEFILADKLEECKSYDGYINLYFYEKNTVSVTMITNGLASGSSVFPLSWFVIVEVKKPMEPTFLSYLDVTNGLPPQERKNLKLIDH